MARQLRELLCAIALAYNSDVLASQRAADREKSSTSRRRTGALMHGVIFLLHILAKNIKSGIAQDTTVYGSARVSPKTFFAHHVAEIAAAVVFADALTIRLAASHQSRCAVLGDFLVAESISRHGQPSSVGSSASATAV